MVLESFTPDESNMLCASWSFETSETRMGVSSPSRSRNDLAKAAARNHRHSSVSSGSLHLVPCGSRKRRSKHALKTK